VKRTPAPTARALLAALCVSGLAALGAVPFALERWQLSHDAVEYLGIAHAWVHGAGFVDPILWSFYLPGSPPLPAFALRPPLVPLLLAMPLASGATLAQVMWIHALWASALVGASVLVARRFMGLPAATAVGIGFGGSLGWSFVARHPWTEATSLGAFLLVLATARGVTHSIPLALACSVASVLAWSTRPNLALVVPAIAAASVWQLGARGAFRCRPLGAYLLGFVALHQLLGLGIRGLGGLGPYAGYGALIEVLGRADFSRYSIGSVDPWTFVLMHRTEILEHVGANAAKLARELLLEPTFHWAGWLFPVALAGAWRGRGPGAFETRFCLATSLLLALWAVSSWAPFDSRRYPLLVAMPAWFAAMASLERLGSRLGGGAGTTSSRARLLRLAPPGLALSLFAAGSATPMVRELRELSLRWRGGPALEILDDWDGTARRWCHRLEPDALVAAPNPWAFLLWCGNAGMRVPSDLRSQAELARFLAERRPRYVVSHGGRRLALLERSPLLVERAREQRRVLFEQVDPPRPAPWRAPPPLACAGKGPSCSRELPAPVR
jgi:hypothetical protein